MDQVVVNELLSAGCETFMVPGAQLGLLRDDERLVVCAGATSAGGRPVLTDTRFHAGSLAKSLAALLVLDAARRGDIDLGVGCDQQADGLWSDTPLALMAQTTGRPNVLPEDEEGLEAFVTRSEAMPRTHPEGRFSYCNAGWSVLDLLLRRRCGGSFEELAQKALPFPLTFGMPEDGAPGHVTSAAGPTPTVASDAPETASAAGARWWATADQLLDYAAMHLDEGAGRFDPADVRKQRRPHVQVPGATMADSWGLGWALWHRGEHHAFGWAGYTAGHRTFLRCFPDQRAAVVLMTNSAGPLLGPPGGSALFDTILPDLLGVLDVPPLTDPVYDVGGRPVGELAGSYGPLVVERATDDDSFVLHAAAFGESEPVPHRRIGGDSFAREGRPPGGMVLAFDGDLLYLGPFAVPRN